MNATDHSPPPRQLPTWLVFLLSVAIVVHFTSVIAAVLAAPSGPWPAPNGGQPAHPPLFAEILASNLEPMLNGVKLASTFHFNECRPTVACRFEAVLRDENGKEVSRLKFPEENAPAAIRHRQQLLALEINQDEPLEPPPGYWVPPPGQEPRKLPFWQVAEGSREGKLGQIAENSIPRDRPVFAPSPMAVVAAQSYARFLCKSHGAHSCEIIRYSRMLYPPMLLLELNEPNPAMFEEDSRSFGVINAESAAR